MSLVVAQRPGEPPTQFPLIRLQPAHALADRRIIRWERHSLLDGKSSYYYAFLVPEDQFRRTVRVHAQLHDKLPTLAHEAEGSNPLGVGAQHQPGVPLRI